ncbi:MAG: LemA family protein [Thiogranum sp.]|nr:LemA family protein [Thiogranum sp.]
MNKGFFRVALPILALAVVVALSFFTIRYYNYLQLADEEVDAGWAHVVNQYQRRADLVPNLVRVVQAYAVHERTLFRDVAQARAAAVQITPNAELFRDPGRLREYQQAQDNMREAISRLLIVAERYPELRANESFLDLQAQLEGTENRISYARDKYIFAVRSFNVLVRSFPSNLLARRLNYDVHPNLGLESGSTAATAPEVAFQ